MECNQEHFSQSFALQFISLILFVLIFTIWSFLPKIQQQTVISKQHERVASITATDITPLYKTELQKRFFLDDAFTLNDSTWSPVREMIFQHDLSLHVKMRSISDARMVFERLIENEYPEESILVEADPSIEHEQLMVIPGASTWR